MFRPKMSERRRRRARVATAATVALGALGALGVGTAGATLSTTGPTQPDTGFPRYYGDSTGLRLELCLDRSANCLAQFPDPAAPASFPDNFPDESFWWDGTADLTIPGPAGPQAGQALLVMAVEAAFANEVAAGDQIAFTRIRLRIKGGFPNQDYTFTYPYGSPRKIRTDSGGNLSFTSDIGCFSFPCDFPQVTRGEVGPFLKWDATAPAPPAGYIGDPGVLHKVTGSPTGRNFFRVNGGGNTGLPQPSGTNPGGVQTDLFAIQGKIDTGANEPPPPNPQPAASFQPTSLFYAARDVGTTSAAQNVRLTNTGNANMTVSSVTLTGTNPADYAISANDCPATLAANAGCTVSVTFSPSAAGSRTADLTFTDNAAGSPQKVPLTGTGNGAPPPPAPAPNATLTPASLVFANQNNATTSPAQNLTLSNTGNATLNISSVVATGDFARSGGTCGTTLGAGATCTIGVTFTPTVAGARSGTLTVTDDASSGTTQQATLSGTGVAVGPPPTPTAGIAASPNPLAFGNVRAPGFLGLGGQNLTRQVTVTSNGTGPLTLGAVTIGAAATSSVPSNYAVTANTCGTTPRAVGTTCTISVRFTPSARGTRNATLIINSNAAASPTRVALTGTGT